MTSYREDDKTKTCIYVLYVSSKFPDHEQKVKKLKKKKIKKIYEMKSRTPEKHLRKFNKWENGKLEEIKILTFKTNEKLAENVRPVKESDTFEKESLCHETIM